MKFTHNGWFMFCPIKLANMDSDVPTIAPRWGLLAPWFWVNEQAQQLMSYLLSMLNPDYEPAWSIRITGERPNE